MDSVSRHNWVPSRIYGRLAGELFAVGDHGLRPSNLPCMTTSAAVACVFVFADTGVRG